MDLARNRLRMTVFNYACKAAVVKTCQERLGKAWTWKQYGIQNWPNTLWEPLKSDTANVTTSIKFKFRQTLTGNIAHYILGSMIGSGSSGGLQREDSSRLQPPHAFLAICKIVERLG